MFFAIFNHNFSNFYFRFFAFQKKVLWTGVKLRKPDGRNAVGKQLKIVGPTVDFFSIAKNKKNNNAKRREVQL